MTSNSEVSGMLNTSAISDLSGNQQPEVEDPDDIFKRYLKVYFKKDIKDARKELKSIQYGCGHWSIAYKRHVFTLYQLWWIQLGGDFCFPRLDC